MPMRGVFLHTGWRTAGTWLWSRLRDDPAVMGFYEPLHEMLPEMTREQMLEIGAESWNSRHPRMAAGYFVEFLPLLKPGGGVAGAKPEFAFDRFFLNAADAQDELRAYVQNLCDLAGRQGRVPVFKFVRSLGRLAWLRANFPDYAHILVARNPWAQFRSAWLAMVVDENPFFLAAPVVVLARNAANPLVAALIAAFGLPVVPAVADSAAAQIGGSYGEIRAMAPACLYECYFAFWLLCQLHALPAATAVIDGDAGADAMLAALSAATGWHVEPGAAGRAPAPVFRLSAGHDPFSADDVRRCHARAMGRLVEHIDPETTCVIRRWLLAAERHAARDLAPAMQEPKGAELLRGHLPGIHFTF